MITEQSQNDKFHLWGEALPILRCQFPETVYKQHLEPLQPENLTAGVLTLLCPPFSLGWLENRLKLRVLAAVQSVAPDVTDIEFVTEAPPAAHLPLDELEDPEPEEPDAEFTGVYHDKRHAIIQPNRLEVHTQYFRQSWRPLLGPLLSELVRELRQRCHYKTGRNTFRTTYMSLAKALGVSEKTIKRALARDDQGNFKNAYLGYFIASMEILKKSSGKGTLRSLGTQFVIYLDEPLTPEDEANFSKGTK